MNDRIRLYGRRLFCTSGWGRGLYMRECRRDVRVRVATYVRVGFVAWNTGAWVFLLSLHHELLRIDRCWCDFVGVCAGR